MENKKNAKKEIRNLTLLFLMSFLTSVIIALYMILKLGPTGAYTGKNTVIAPDVLQTLKIADHHSPFKILFDKIEFTFFDNQSKTINVDTDAYTKFYLLISSDDSMDEKNAPFEQFDKQTAHITVYTKPEKVVKGGVESYPFQRIEFSDAGDHYRVQLIGDSNSIWAYFKHKGILEKTKKLFIPG